MMEETYKDWKIKLEEKTDEFVATKDDHILRSKSLKELKKKIDKFAFVRIPIYYKDYHVIHSGEITSIAEMSHGNPLLWVTLENKSRTKVNIHYLYRQTENNKKIFDEIQKFEQEKENIRKKIEELAGQLERMTFTDVGIPIGEKENVRNK
jgi:archaellum component FlaC